MKNTHFLLVACLGGFLLAAHQADANLILNGDFENNTAGVSQYNLNPTYFASYLPNVTEFGTAEEIDLVQGADFGLAPPSGSWKLGLHTQTTGLFDGFSFSLSAPIVAGNTYALQFYSVSETQTPVNGIAGNVLIGLSGSSSAFGTQIFAPANAPSLWTLYSITFVAPVNASYLTVESGAVLGSYNSVDAFNLVLVPEPGALAVLLMGGALALRRHLPVPSQNR